MSRIYLTASMPHEKIGTGLPTLSFETNDHTGGGYNIAGLHPSTIAKLAGKGPEVKKGERFDLKFNVNAKRTSLSLVVMTTKHFPHWEWSSDGGAGKLPLAAIGTLAAGFFKNNHRPQDSRSEQSKNSKHSKHQSMFASESAIYTPDGRIRREPLEDRKRRPSKSSHHDSRGLSSSASSSTRTSAHRPEPLPSSSRHSTSRRSSRHSSAHATERPRYSAVRKAGPRKREKDYDSGYASGEEASDSYASRDSSRRGGGRKGGRRE